MRCSTCGEWMYSSRHACPPIFEVNYPEYGDEWREIRAIDAETAAEKWAEREDSESAEYSIVGGRETPVVNVRGPDGSVTRWIISGEAVPKYYASEEQSK